MKHLLVALFLIFPICASAQSLPAFYDVSDVATDDVLNIRDKPTTSSEIIGELEFDRTAIEVVALNEEQDWAQINFEERTGWVSLRFMTRQPGQSLGKPPYPLSCYGTEPFWSLDISPDPHMEFHWAGEEPKKFESVFTVESVNRTDRSALFAEGEHGLLTSVLQRQICSDGMSDRLYGVNIDMFLTDDTGVTFFSGCCTLER